MVTFFDIDALLWVTAALGHSGVVYAAVMPPSTSSD
jgi:hypothetical protein